ncbi:pilus assembly FimT family protein [Neobacillus sp. Marseille-QA0830]
MQRCPSKESGVTLIETLAVLTILSIVIVLAYNIFFSGISNSDKAERTVLLQQEMNLVIQSITESHETQDSYDIVVDTTPFASHIILKGIKDGVTRTTEISNPNFEYALYDISGTTGKVMDNPKKITNTSSQPLSIKVIIRNKQHPSEKYEVSTIISRL